MKKWIIPTICIICAVFIFVRSCSRHVGDNYISIGTTYNKFLFFPEKNAHFNIYFKSKYTGNLTLIDDNNKPLSNSKYIINVDGQKSNASFLVRNKNVVHVSIRCKQSVSPGKQYIQVRGGGPLVTHVYFQHHFNPLFAWLSWIVTTLAIISLIWFSFLRRLFFPQFKSCQKTFFIPNQAPIIAKLTGARMVVISSENKKQGFWDTLIKGPIVYITHPTFVKPLVMRPANGRKILIKADTNTYRISPNPLPCIGQGSIDDIHSNMHITIN